MNDYKYLIIFEDGEVSKSINIDSNDMDAANNGVLHIIRLSDLKSYYNNEWTDIKSWMI